MRIMHDAAEPPNMPNDFFSMVGQKLVVNIPYGNCHYKEYLTNINFISSFFFELLIWLGKGIKWLIMCSSALYLLCMRFLQRL